MQKITHLPLALLSLSLLLACDPVSEVKLPPHQARLVVNAYLVEGREVLVDVSKSVGILQEDEPALRLVKDAKVELMEDGQPVAVPVYTDSVPNVYNPDWGMYKSTFKPRAGHQYQIRVSHAALGVATAQTRIPSKPNVSNVRFELNAGQDEDGGELSAIFFTLSDPPGEQNFYEIFSLMHYEKQQLDSVVIQTRLGPLGDRVGNGQFIEDYTRAPGLLTDELFDGQSREIALFFWSGSGVLRNGVPQPLRIVDISLIVRSCDMHYFEYRSLIDLHLDIQNEEAPLFPAEPVAAYSNVSGGYGIVGSYHAFRQQVY